MAIYTLKNLMEDSIRVYPGMVAVWPQFKENREINVDVATFNGSYASNNGTLAFVVDNTLYVTPSTSRALKVLASFSKESFYVPFSNGDYPSGQLYRWNQLLEKKRQLLEDDFSQECIKYCDEHNIGELDEETLSRCFVIPSTGVKVKHLHFENTYYPIINTYIFGYEVSDNLGKFNSNNGKVIFVYRDGRTMVTKGYKVLDKLRDAGYTEDSLYVPFSNGETILNTELAKKWDSIRK